MFFFRVTHWLKAKVHLNTSILGSVTLGNSLPTLLSFCFYKMGTLIIFISKGKLLEHLRHFAPSKAAICLGDVIMRSSPHGVGVAFLSSPGWKAEPHGLPSLSVTS